MAFLGRLVSIGIAKEATRGTYVAPTYWEKHDALKIDDEIDEVVDDAAAGVIEAGENSFGVAKYSKFEIDTKIKDKTFGLWLLAIMGTDTPALHSGETLVYDHVYSVAETNQHQSLSLSVKDPVQSYKYALGCIDTVELTFEVGKIAVVKINGMAQLGVTVSPTVAMTAQNYFLPQYMTYKDASLSTGLAGATAKKIKKFTVKITKNLERDMVLGSAAPNDFFNKTFNVEGTIEAFFSNESDFKTGFIADGYRAMLLDAINTDVTIGTAANPELKVQLNRCKIKSLGRDLGIGNIVKQTVSFAGLYDLTTSAQLLITLTNLVASY